LADLLKSDWIPSSACSTFAELGRLVDGPILLRRQANACAVRAAALVGPRKVDAEAQAVETSSETDSPLARILPA
jgi:hypothetical protein